MQARIFESTIGGGATAPPSKSMAHRAVLCAGLAAGQSRVDNLSFSEDIRATLRAVQAFGARATLEPGAALIRGASPLTAPAGPVHCGESGSTLRFLIPILAQAGGPVRLTGEGRLPQRPQGVYQELFTRRGLEFRQDETGVSLCGPLPGGSYQLPGNVSSQFISGLLFALPLASQDSIIEILPPFESKSYVNLTLGALADFGIKAGWQSPCSLWVKGGQRYRARDYTVEGDWSNAAFFAVLGALTGGVTLSGLRRDTLQGDAVILDILARCGARFSFDGAGGLRFEKAPLHAAAIDLADCPDLGPVLMVLAHFCQGRTRILHAGRLRIKESDRIAAMQAELAKFGGAVREVDGDTLEIEGCALHPPAGALCGQGDHRVVMACTVAALAAGVPAIIEGAGAVAKSWPEFFEAVKGLGAKVECGDE